MPRWQRQLLWALGIGLALLLIAGLVGPQLAKWYLLQRAVPRVAKQVGRQIQVRRARVGYGWLELQAVAVQAPLEKTPGITVPRVQLSFRLWPLLGGRLELDDVLVEKPRVHLWRGKDGASNFADLLARVRGRKPGRAVDRKAPRSGRLTVEKVRVRGGEASFEDRELGLAVSAISLRADLVNNGRQRVDLGTVAVDLPLVGRRMAFDEVRLRGRASQPSVELLGGRLQLLPRLTLSGITGTLRRAKQRVLVDVTGSYGGASAKLWDASGWLLPEQRRGELRVRAARFSLGRIAEILRSAPVIRPDQTTVDGQMDILIEPRSVGITGSLAVSNLNVFHPRLARVPVRGISGAAHLSARLDYRAAKGESAEHLPALRLEQLSFATRGAKATISGEIQRLRDQPLVNLQVIVPEMPCQKMLAAFPPTLIPHLTGFRLKGKFSVNVLAHVDYRDLEAVKLKGAIGINGCRVLEAPEGFDAERLTKPFEHLVEAAPGEMLSFIVGPASESFVPFHTVSPHLINAFLTTEDGAFFRHRGFITSQFRAALSRNLKRGGFRLGASTITMQTVKNVWLTHEKTLSRKLQEAFLTWYLERRLSKQRILEIYLNAIEFGPHLFGLGAATRHYFGKLPSEVTPLEAAFFSSILPSPRRRYVHYCRGKLSPKWDARVRRILKEMYKRGYVSDEDYQTASEQDLIFDRDFNEESARDCIERIEDLGKAWDTEAWRRLKEAVQRAAPHQLEQYIPSPQDSTKSR